MRRARAARAMLVALLGLSAVAALAPPARSEAARRSPAAVEATEAASAPAVPPSGPEPSEPGSPAPASSPAAVPSDAIPAFFPPPAPAPEPEPQPVWTLLPVAVRPGDAGRTWEPDEIAALRRDLGELLDGSPLRGAHAAFFAVDSRSGRVLVDERGGDVVQPASTFKLLVGSAALDALGPAFRFRTVGGLVGGELLELRGGGDPFLSASDIDGFAAAVARSGLRFAARGLAINTSHFDGAAYAPGWTWDDFLQSYAPKISAATFEENVLHVFVESGGRAGASAIVHVRPIPAGRTSAIESCVPSVEPEIGGRVATLAAGAEETLDVTSDAAGCPILTGGIAADSSGSSIDVAVADPAAYLYRAAVDYLHARGVDVARPLVSIANGRPSITTDAPLDSPASTIYWTHDSPPLAQMLPRFWIPSDNLVGENLLKELGVAAAGAPGTREKGIAYERRWLKSLGIDPSPFTFADGCGMSQYDRISPHALVAILQHDWNGPHRELVLDALPVGGARGHIEGIDGTPAAGRVWAKTGSMMHVRGLAGYIATRTRGTVTFAFNVDDFTGDYDELAALRARVLSRIARE